MLRLDALELASGLVVGVDSGTEPLQPGGSPDVRAALDRAILPALTRGPCCVAFSGGVDSTAVLAAAVALARRESLPDPVPMMLRFPGVAETHESQWQDSVLVALGIGERVHVEIASSSLDYVGRYAAEAHRLVGAHWPPNAHSLLPLMERASGGALLTGVDGDGLFRTWAWRWVPRGVPRDAKELARLARAHLPPGGVRWWLRARQAPRLDWLEPEARRRVVRRWAEHAASEPRRWDERVGWWHRLRYVAMFRDVLARLAAPHDVTLVHPFMDPDVLSSVAVAGGAAGFATRDRALSALLPGLLPPHVLARDDKATFVEAFFTAESREFVADWAGPDPTGGLVNVDALRREWSTQFPVFETMPLLQAARFGTGS